MVSIEVLRSFPYFAGVCAESLKAVAAITEERPLALGEPLFKEGDPARALYILRAGQVDIVYQHHRDQGCVVDTVVAGDLIAAPRPPSRANPARSYGSTPWEFAVCASATIRWDFNC